MIIRHYIHILVLVYLHLNFFVQLSVADSTLIIGVLAYTYTWWALREVGILHLYVIQDWIIVIGVTIFVVFSLSSKKVSVILVKRPLVYLGEISYSLYLIHCISLFSYIYLLNELVPIWIIWLISLISTLILSAISYKFIEQPSIKLGKVVQKTILKSKDSYVTKESEHKI